MNATETSPVSSSPDHPPGDVLDERAAVLSNERLAPGLLAMRLCAPEIARRAAPGQFCMLRVSGKNVSPLLRRPFSFLDVSPAEGWVDLLYAVVGQGTALMEAWAPGVRARLLGPLGRGFPLDVPDHAVLAGGGIGLAPLLHLARTLREKRADARITLSAGARTGAQLAVLSRFEPWCSEIVAATDDGTRGHHGVLTEPLETVLGDAGENALAYACGPRAMLRAVRDAALRAGVEGYLSDEAAMACGFGVCNGCVVRVRGEDGRARYSRACVDGPVYRLSERVFG